jgi:peroxiredoxin
MTGGVRGTPPVKIAVLRPRPARDGNDVQTTSPALAPGSRFPDFALTDHSGSRRELSELIAADPVVLQFYRGWWCPKEQAFFRRLVAFQDEVEVAYARVISVSVDAPEVSAAFRAGLSARWTFLSDTDRSLQARLGLRESTDTVHDPYVPAVFTLFPDRTIHRAYDGYWFWGRPTLEELRADMRAVTRTIRSDWEAPAV